MQISVFFFSIRDILESHNNFPSQGHRSKIVQVILVFCWSIWRTRNKRLFKGNKQASL
ncbi:hypothetical protein HanRHA438_Chr11g0497661 [Helianthus annuus]|nr:hypothetical protein HanRHA438_Chr11g0497661 [Helianthus annuus]